MAIGTLALPCESVLGLSLAFSFSLDLEWPASPVLIRAPARGFASSKTWMGRASPGLRAKGSFSGTISKEGPTGLAKLSHDIRRALAYFRLFHDLRRVVEHHAPSTLIRTVVRVDC